MLLLLLTGFASLLAQVVLLRELSVAFYGIELIYLLAISLWMIGSGLGALPAHRSRPSEMQVSFLLLITALLLPLDVLYIRAMRILLGGVPGAYLPFAKQLLGMAIALLPSGLLMGFLFQRAAACYVDGKRTLASAYAIESLGAMLGGIASLMFVALGVQNFAAVLSCSAVALSAVVCSLSISRRRLAISFLSLTLMALLVFTFWHVNELDYAMTRWSHPQLAASRDTPYGRVTADTLQGQVSVYENDALSFESEGTSAEEFAHVALSAHPSPRRIFLIGGALEGLVAEACKYQPQQVDCIELNSAMLDIVRPLLPASLRAPLAAANVHIIIGDSRTRLLTLGRYDAILIAMPDPASAQTNRFYTTDFFRLAREHLESGGIFSLRLRSAENFWTEQLAERNASVVAALRAVFADVIVFPGVSNVLVAGTASLSHDPEIAVTRLRQIGGHTRLVTPDYLRYLYTNDRFSSIASRLSATSVSVNSDAHPVCFRYALSLWLSKFSSRLLNPRITVLQSRLAGFRFLAAMFGLFALCFLIARRFRRLRLALLTGVAGCSGMLLETVLIIQYQTKRGVLYQDIGVLLTLFMVGLALGAFLLARFAVRIRDAQSVVPPLSISRPGLLGALLLMAFCLTGQWIALDIIANSAGLAIVIGISLVLSGFFVGAVFGYAGLLYGPDQQRAISHLYAADLLGGAIGAAAGSLVAVPLLGLPGTALSASILSFLALLLL
jgi:spermidine synthase